MSAETARHVRTGGGPLVVPPQPPPDRSLIDAVSGFINDVKLTSSAAPDPKDVIQWARFETTDINEPNPEGDTCEISPLLLILGYGSGVQAWLIPPNGDAQEILSWRQGTVRALRILPTPQGPDSFASKRPLLALCDSASPGPTFCSLSFISIRGGEQVKSIKFKNPILDVLANKRSIVVSFSERFAVFDAGTLEDRMAVTTCYPCPCPLGGSAPINPLALGDRWLAYADKKLNPSKRSNGGCEGEGITSYTATVLHAAKSLGKGLRGLGESVAQSLAGARGASPPRAEHQPGVVTIIDIEGNTDEDIQESEEPYDPIVAHFVAHSDSILGMKFDPSGMLLITGDKRGHDFHVFRIHPHPCGPSLATVQHLYILHRGDTTAKLQDIAISSDSRWAAVSTLRGTTHVFPVAPYGGAAGVRTHTQARVVNRLSRFQRSAGLPPLLHPLHPLPARSASPIDPAYGRTGETGAAISESTSGSPVYVTPLAQLRRHHLPSNTVTRSSSGRQRLSSLSEDNNSPPLLARATFGPCPAPISNIAGTNKTAAQLSLYLISANGTLLHLALTPRPSKSVPKEKVCEESPVELEVEGVCQWALSRPAAAADLLLPLSPASPLLLPAHMRTCEASVSCEERWLSQVEIVTHAGPHRRLWMGPQFVFKTYTTHGSSTSLSEAETVEVGSAVARSTPVNMPNVRPILPALIHSGSNSSLEHSPVDSFRRKSLLTESGRAASVCDVQLREDLAEAMKEDHGGAWVSEAEWCDCGGGGGGGGGGGVARAVDPLGTVSARGQQSPPPPPPDDEHTLANEDEARFRPVVAARAPLPAPEPRARPLPLHTTIPVQTLLHTLHTLPHSNIQPSDIQPDRSKETSPHRDTSFKNKQRTAKSDQPLHTSDAIESVTNVENVTIDVNVVPVRDTEHCEESEDIIKSNKKCKNNESEQSYECAKDDERKENRIDKSNYLNKIPEVIDSDRRTKSGSVGPDIVKRKTLSAESKQVNKKVRGCSQPRSGGKNVNETVPEKLAQGSQSSLSYTENEGVKEDVKNQFKQTAVASESKTIAPQEVNIKMNKKGKEKSKDNDTKNNTLTSLTNQPVKECKTGTEYKNEEINIGVRENVPANDYTDIQVLPEPMPENEESFVTATIQLKPMKQHDSLNQNKCVDNIKTEEQAWDMLLNETEKTVATMIQTTSAKEAITDEPKVKSKRNRKNKRTNEETSTKLDDDSFVEIHAIEKTQECAGDLVSISEPLPSGDYSRSSTKTRSPKGATPERNYDSQLEAFDVIQEVKVNTVEDNKDYLYVEPDPVPDIRKRSLELLEDNFSSIHVHHIEGTLSENTSFIAKEPAPRTKKCKSLSPCPDAQKNRPTPKPTSVAKKDYIVIDTSKDEFPDIKITSGNKNRKKSPQVEEPVVIEKQPVKSWSTIAASKGKVSDEDVKPETSNVDNTSEEADNMSFEDKLVKLCKITDILVAECDAPTELTFVEEHHTIPELPPLEPLDFALDGFKLDVMKDSLLETNESKNSPICKINIDDILSSIKDTTNKVLESSTFNFVDLEKVPQKREKGFSIVESENITTQEIDINAGDNNRKTNEEIMEKSSDDDNTSPVLSTDSDKDDKKQASVSVSAPLLKPSASQSAKAKKSRRKKK